MTTTPDALDNITRIAKKSSDLLARAEAAEANLLAVREALAAMIDERDAALAEAERLRGELADCQRQANNVVASLDEACNEVERLRAQVAMLQGTLGFAAQYIAKAHADGAYNNTAMSGERALRIIGEALTDNTRQDAT